RRGEQRHEHHVGDAEREPETQRGGGGGGKSENAAGGVQEPDGPVGESEEGEPRQREGGTQRHEEDAETAIKGGEHGATDRRLARRGSSSSSSARGRGPGRRGRQVEAAPVPVRNVGALEAAPQLIHAAHELAEHARERVGAERREPPVLTDAADTL